MEFIKNYLNVVLLVLFVLSVGTNVYFLTGSGVVINQDKRITNNNTNYQQQWQGQLLVHMWTVQGNRLEWIEEDIPNGKFVETINALHPISSFYLKIIKVRAADTSVIYPTIFTEKK